MEDTGLGIPLAGVPPLLAVVALVCFAFDYGMLKIDADESGDEPAI